MTLSPRGSLHHLWGTACLLLPCLSLLLCSSCGLAEELEQESKGAKTISKPKSACGSVSVTLCPYATTMAVNTSIFVKPVCNCWPDLLTCISVLPGRCLPMCQLSVHWDACLQTWGEDCTSQHRAKWCLGTTTIYTFWNITFLTSF